jgi:hypothetical protein
MGARTKYAAIFGCFGCCLGLACGGSTRGETSGGSAETGASGGGGSLAAGSGASETSGDSGSTAGSSGAGAATSGGAAGTSGGASSTGGVGDAPSGGDGGAGDGGDFIWTGYDLTDVDLDESSSGTPVPLGDPGNDYGQTAPTDEPGAMLACLDTGASAIDASCMQFLVCDYPCSTSEDCPAVDSGTTTPQCGGLSRPDSCTLTCGDGRICPDGMACVLFGLEFICAWPSPIMFPGCPDYCAEQDAGCDSWTTGECCEGLVCAPWGQCELGSCLRLSWPCTEATAPCCEGTVCVDGYCSEI